MVRFTTCFNYISRVCLLCAHRRERDSKAVAWNSMRKRKIFIARRWIFFSYSTQPTAVHSFFRSFGGECWGKHPTSDGRDDEPMLKWKEKQTHENSSTTSLRLSHQLFYNCCFCTDSARGLPQLYTADPIDVARDEEEMLSNEIFSSPSFSFVSPLHQLSRVFSFTARVEEIVYIFFPPRLRVPYHHPSKWWKKRRRAKEISCSPEKRKINSSDIQPSQQKKAR